MQLIRSVPQMQQCALQWRAEGKRIALVPTMGCLHEGHLQLVEGARACSDVTLLSIFVNPTQFGEHEDLEKYPRTFEADQQLAQERGVDVLFAPSAEEIYPSSYQTSIEVAPLSRGLCGSFRPGHFRGVATVVAKLLLITQAQVTVFGEKDYQQLKIVERMVSDLNMPVHILAMPVVREAEGLALSSRNRYLTDAARYEALYLWKSLCLARQLVQAGEIEVSSLLQQVRACLSQAPHLLIQYAEIVDAQTLEPMTRLDRPARLVLAVYLWGTRLIDNIALSPPLGLL